LEWYKVTTLRKFRIDLGWSTARLASESGVSRAAIRSAEEGKSIHAETAKAIADAISHGMGREIKPSEIEGLNIL
jgi:transcriptional regulator with XRE-family HTH domain